MSYATRNRIKSVFIGFYPMVATGAAAYAVWRAAVSSEVSGWGWLSLLGPTLPILVFLARVMIFRDLARTRVNLRGLTVLAVLGVAASGVAVFFGASLELPVWTVCTTALLRLYTHWYSGLGRTPSQRIAVLKPFPDVSFESSDGELVSLDRYRGGPLILMFYRGNWCPLCVAQIKEIAASYREIADLGAHVVLISPQPAGHSARLAERFDAPMDFLVDRDARAARSLEIDMPNGLPMGMQMFGYADDTVLPTVVVLDAEGVVRWLDETDNYRVRPEPETFLPILRELSVRPGRQGS